MVRFPAIQLFQLRHRAAIDMGSWNTRVVVPGRGLVLNEHSAITRKRQKRWIGLNAPTPISVGSIA